MECMKYRINYLIRFIKLKLVIEYWFNFYHYYDITYSNSIVYQKKKIDMVVDPFAERKKEKSETIV